MAIPSDERDYPWFLPQHASIDGGSWVRPRLVGWPDFQFDTSQVIHEALVRGEYLPSDWAKLQGYRDALMERAES